MPVILVISFYRELRNYLVFAIWFLIGIGHIFLYQLAGKRADLSIFAIKPLLALPAILVAFQLFRLFYLFLKKRELIITYGRTVWYDEADNRNITWLDVVFSILVYAAAVLVCIL